MSIELRGRLRSSLYVLTAVAMMGAGLLTDFASAQQQGSGGAVAREACAADFRSLCAGVQPGGGRILACLKQNEAKLSPNCQQALAAAKSARRSSSTNQ